jgi:hypothetical protein
MISPVARARLWGSVFDNAPDRPPIQRPFIQTRMVESLLPSEPLAGETKQDHTEHIVRS